MEKRPEEGAPAPESHGRRLPRGGRLFGPVLGLLFLAYPIQALLTSNPSPARLLFALAGTTLFVGVFLWLLWVREPLRAATAESSAIRKHRAAVASLAALALVLALVCGGEWLTLLFHVSIAAGVTLPHRDAYAAIAGLALLAVATGRLSGMGWLEVGRFVLPAALLGLWATAFIRSYHTILELRAAREEIARLAVAEERLRFARDLHDLLGHSLTLITLKSELAGRLLPAAPERAAEEVRDIEGVARRALREVREAVAGYRRSTLDEELDSAREMLEAAGIACRIERDVGVLPPRTDAVLAWVVREGVTNAIRHSRAEHCKIRFVQEGEEVRVEVRDDGLGSQPERGGTYGSGLSGLAERVAASGGDFEAESPPEGGFRLRVSVPLRDGSSTGEDGRR